MCIIYGADYLIFRYYCSHISASGGKPTGYHLYTKNPNISLQLQIIVCKISVSFLRIVWQRGKKIQINKVKQGYLEYVN